MDQLAGSTTQVKIVRWTWNANQATALRFMSVDSE